MKKIIVHAGVHKTGTTSIQNFLYSNHEQLANDGYNYVVELGENHSVPILNCFAQLEKYKLISSIDNTEDILKKYLNDDKVRNLVISGEDISFMGAEALERFRSFCIANCDENIEFEIIIYFRSGQSWIDSLVQENVKWLMNNTDAKKLVLRDIDQYMKGRIEPFEKVFGDNFIKIFNFNNSIAEYGDIKKHFLNEVLKLNDDSYNLTSNNENTSSSQVCVDFLSYLVDNTDIKEHELRQIFNKTYYYLNSSDFNRYNASETFASFVLKDSYHDVKWVERRYGIDFSWQLDDTSTNQQLDTYSSENIKKYIDRIKDDEFLVKKFMDFIAFIEKNEHCKIVEKENLDCKEDKIMKLSVLLVTYNQEMFISDTLESILMQDCNFKYNIVVADDKSQDRTLDIIKEFDEKYPDIEFIYLNDDENLGITKNYKRGFKEACKSEYVAVIEGDDLWTNKFRLRKHVEFLNEHRECSMSFNQIMCWVPETNQYNFQPISNGNEYELRTMLSLIYENFIGNFSCCVYRSSDLLKINEKIYDIKAYDWAINMAIGEFGLLGFLTEPMSIYRINSKGTWSSMSAEDQAEEIIETCHLYDKFFEGKYSEHFEYIIKYNSQDKLISPTEKRKLNYIFNYWLPPIVKKIVIACLPEALYSKIRGRRA